MVSAVSGVVLLAFFTFGRGFFTLARTALVNSHRARLRQLAEAGVRGAAWAERVSEDSSRLLVTVRFGQTLFSLLAASTAALVFAPPVWRWLAQLGMAMPTASGVAVLSIAFLVAVVLLLFGETLPDLVALKNPEQIALSLAWILHLFSIPFTPLAKLIMRISQLVAGPTSTDHAALSLVTEEEIKTLVDAGQEEGVIEEDEKEMIYSIFRFGDTAAREVMVPRIDVVAVDVETPLEDALRIMVGAGHSRMPVYQGSIDNTQGILYAKDILALQVTTEPTEDNPPIARLLRPAHFVPESKKLDDLLADMQLRKVHIAIVVDEYGGTAGIVTIEDILEEIVGEIQDEYDSEEATFQLMANDEYVFNARIDLDDVNDLLGTRYPTEQGDTLGGFIFSQLGKVPTPGEVIESDGYRIEVLSVVNRRIHQVRISPLPIEQPAEAGED